MLVLVPSMEDAVSVMNEEYSGVEVFSVAVSPVVSSVDSSVGATVVLGMVHGQLVMVKVVGVVTV